jgi:hypothetical protein
VFAALVIQHAKRMRRIILSFVACPSVIYSSTLSHKWQGFSERKVFERKIYVSVFSKTSI